MVGPKALAALLLTLCLAGCSGADPPGDGATSSGSSSSGPPGDLGNGTLPRIQDPWRVTLYLTESGGLQREVPAAGAVPFGFPLSGLAAGVDLPAFSQAALGHAILVGPDDVVVTLYVTSQGPQVSNGNFDVAMWFGSSAQMGLGSITTGQQFTAPGDVQRIEETLAFGDRLPLFIEGDDEVTLQAAGSFGGESGEPSLVVGGDTPSSVEFTVRNYTVDPLAGAVALDAQAFSGEVRNVSGPACAEMEGATLDHDFTVAADAVLVRVVLSKASSAAAGADNDLGLLDGTRQIAGSHSAKADEAILLAADTLDGLQGKTLTARVHACGPGPIQYDLEVEQSKLPT